MALQAGLKKAEPLPKSLTISVPASRVRVTSLSICSLVAISVERHAADRGQAGQGNHVRPVPAQDRPGDVGDGHAELHGDEGPPAGRVQRPGHADDLVLGEAGDLVEDVDHGVEGIGDDDAEGLGGVLLDARRRPRR